MKTWRRSQETSAGREKIRWKVIRFLLYFVITFFVIVGRSAQWVTEEWGDLTLDEVIFTMTQPLKGTDSGIIWSYITYSVVPGVIIFAVLFLVYHIFLMPKQPPKGKTIKENGEKITIPAELTPEQSAALAADSEKEKDESAPPAPPVYSGMRRYRGRVRHHACCRAVEQARRFRAHQLSQENSTYIETTMRIRQP